LVMVEASNRSFRLSLQTNAGNRARVDGGGGIDTLKLDGAGLTLVEIIDIEFQGIVA
jgi:hypothetical protein